MSPLDAAGMAIKQQAVDLHHPVNPLVIGRLQASGQRLALEDGVDTSVAVGWQLGDERLDLCHEFVVWQRRPANRFFGRSRMRSIRLERETPITSATALLATVHHRLRLLAFPMRTGGCCRTVDREISRFPRKERLHTPGSLTTPGHPDARDDALGCVAFHHLHGVGTQNRKLSRLNGWPMRPPVNASPRPSRATAHDSGPMWIATVVRKSFPVCPRKQTSDLRVNADTY